MESLIAKLKLSGLRFGRLTVLREVAAIDGRTAFECLCDCGKLKVVEGRRLRKKVRPVKSCGCLVADAVRAANTVHGMKGTPTHYSWVAMLSRCRNVRTKDYARYGAVGITVCERWLDFVHFYADMGPRPESTTLDRLDSTAGYTPENCRWATSAQQAANRKSTTFATVRICALEKALGFLRGRLTRRLINGWDIEDAILTPVGKLPKRREKIKESA